MCEFYDNGQSLVQAHLSVTLTGFTKEVHVHTEDAARRKLLLPSLRFLVPRVTAG